MQRVPANGGYFDNDLSRVEKFRPFGPGICGAVATQKQAG